jgi:outer membrane protein OmpA-like peptidoglycan-associated protein
MTSRSQIQRFLNGMGLNGMRLAGFAKIAVMTLAALVVVWSPARSSAQELDLPELQVERFRPAPGPADYLNVFGTGVPKHLEWGGSFYLGIADDPMQISTRNYPFRETIDDQTTLSLLGYVGLYDNFEVGILLPITVLQTSQELQPILPPGSSSTTDLSLMALNDWRLSGKYQILDLLKDPLGLAVVGGLYIPAATSNTLTSDGGFGGELLAAADYWLWRGIRVGANLGYRYRATREVLRDSTIGDEIVWGVAFNVPLFIDELDAILEIDGAIGVASDEGHGGLSKGEVPAELKFAGRYAISDQWTATFGLGSSLGDGIGSPDMRAFIGLGGYWVSGGRWSYDYDGDGFYGSIDLCPDELEDIDGFEDHDGCPDPDNDGDGVPDSVDRCPGTPPGSQVRTDGCIDNDLDGDGIPNSKDDCPEDPEDLDGFEDGDGCPDTDNDGDGVPDTVDQCPNEAETVNGFMDKDGCPDNPSEKVTITDGQLVIADKVHFETAKATIRQESYEILDEVARVLSDNAQIQLLRIEGHTDDRGSESYNQKLSQRRAESVREYLIDKGVNSDRLIAVGYGEAQPIADNETKQGRSDNRRVAFTILKTSSSVLE